MIASYRRAAAGAIAVLLAAAAAPAAGSDDTLARVRKAVSSGLDPESLAAHVSAATVHMAGQEVGRVETLAQRSPRALRESSEIAGVRQVVTLLGDDGWLEDTNGTIRELTGDELSGARMAHSLLFHSYLDGSDADLLVEVEGGVVTLRPRDGTGEAHLTIGEGSLPVAFERTMSGTLARTTFSDWRPAAGVLWPFASTQTTGDPRFDLTLLTVEVDYPEALPAGAIPTPSAGPARDFVVSDPDSAASIAFELAGSLIVLPARVGDRPGRFLLDTGAGATVLDAAFCEALGLEPRGAMEARGAGGSQTARFVDVERFHLPGIEISGQTVVTVPLEEVGRALGTQVDGILGYDFLSRFAVEIDYPAKRMALFRSGSYSPRDGAIRVPLRIETNVPRLDGVLEGEHAGSFLLDTGNAYPLLLHAPFVRRNGLAEAGGEDLSITGVGGAETMTRTQVDSLALGDAVFRDVPALLATSESGAIALEESIGNVGGALFLDSVLAFDYGAGSLWLARPARADSASAR
jgi:predicted aspartyl protease